MPAAGSAEPPRNLQSWLVDGLGRAVLQRSLDQLLHLALHFLRQRLLVTAHLFLLVADLLLLAAERLLALAQLALELLELALFVAFALVAALAPESAMRLAKGDIR